jgi:hypothetical protein
MFAALQTYANTTMPAAMNLRLFTNRYSTTLTGVYYGSQADFKTAIQPLIDQLPQTSSPSISSKGWLDTLLANSNGPLASSINYDYVSTYATASDMKLTIVA